MTIAARRSGRRRSGHRPLLFLLAVLTCASAAGCAGVSLDVPLISRGRTGHGAADEGRPARAVGSTAGRAREAASTLPTRLTALQAAFLSNDAARLAPFFPQRGPVFVSVPPLQEGGFLSPGSLKAFLDRLVRERVSVGFDLPAGSAPPTPLDRDAASAFVKVKWTHRPAASGTLQVDYLHLALRYTAEDAEWQIVEIKTSIR